MLVILMLTNFSVVVAVVKCRTRKKLRLPLVFWYKNDDDYYCFSFVFFALQYKKFILNCYYHAK